ncbi:hypothetical protein ACOCJ7_16095 [Knoellia sp. CPCC 206453]|uniref:hypothetical protein n=1 Tax=Knoellia pratensis TaxID=3404796 RepID=UPI00360B5CD8
MSRLAESPKREAALRSASAVGWVTLPIGLALVAAPARIGRVLALGDHPAALRAIGALDLALVPGLLVGRHRRPWLVARVALNLGIAAYCAGLVRSERSKGAMVGVAAMVAASVADSRTIADLGDG